jgi:hypothetical protein
MGGLRVPWRKRLCYSSIIGQGRSASRTKKRKAIEGLLDASLVTKWILSNAHPCCTHWLRIRSKTSSVTTLVSTTL